MSAEFSHRLPLAHVPAAGQALHLEADAGERAALARRFDLLALHSFTADLRLKPGLEGAILVTGRMTAELEQACGITLVPVRQSIAERAWSPATARTTRMTSKASRARPIWPRRWPSNYPWRSIPIRARPAPKCPIWKAGAPMAPSPPC